MDKAFIQLITERPKLVTSKTADKKKVLNVNDRCDRCGAQAYVKVVGVTGELMFCSHHYNKIMSDEKGKSSMESFAFETIDERDFVYDQ